MQGQNLLLGILSLLFLLDDAKEYLKTSPPAI